MPTSQLSVPAVIPSLVAPSYGPRGERARIRYYIEPSAFGRVLVASTAAGVCGVSIGEDDAELVASLRERLNRADISAAGIEDETVRQRAFAVVACVTPDDAAVGRALPAVPSQGVNLRQIPLDIAGTPFQRSVWQALRAIPRGQTRTYQQVAVAIGRPTACRAVAGACGANPVALVIPCHRVVGSDGGLGGFYWGVNLKKRLLELEQV